MSTKKKSVGGNPAGKTKQTFIIRKTQPCLPHGAASSYSGPNLILDFLGQEISPDRKEAFSSIVLNKEIAIDLKTRMEKYLDYLNSIKLREDN